jgi:sugar fermentation stimulation protein A
MAASAKSDSHSSECRAAAPDVALDADVAARFVARPHRFLILARLPDHGPHPGAIVRAACRDPGRLDTLLWPGAELRLRAAHAPGRRTEYDAVLVRAHGVWVSLVPSLANELVAARLAGAGLPGLAGARHIEREVRHGRSRFDFRLHDRRGPRWLEVKSVGLVLAGEALFPDAPTLRGARHLAELTAWVRAGGRAALVFVVQREDARLVRPHVARDPRFAAALAEARRAGVRLLAYVWRLEPAGASWLRRVPVHITAAHAGPHVGPTDGV